MYSLSARRLTLMVIGCAPIILASIAHAASNTDPYWYDQTFNQGDIVEDRFAATTTDSHLQGQHLAIAANGDIIVAGIVPAAYQTTLTPNNVGLVRYSASGARIAWSGPTAAYSYYLNHYVDYPNSVNGEINRIDDIKILNGYIYVLVDIIASNGNRDVRVLDFTDGGALVQDMPAFTTTLDETGASLVPYFYLVRNGVVERNMIATATYTTSAGRQIITMKRFSVGSYGSLSVDTSFGISNNGAMDQAAPNYLCVAGANCSWVVNRATALRIATTNPTLYLTGTLTKSDTESDPIVIAVNGTDGSLATTFGSSNGIYVDGSSSAYGVTGAEGDALVATTSGDATTDVIYVASDAPSFCNGSKGSVSKLVLVPPTRVGQIPHTAPDPNWGNGGTTDIAGPTFNCLPKASINLTGIALDGNRLAFSGVDNSVTPPLPVFAIVRMSDGALTEYVRNSLPPLRPDGTPWGGATFSDIVAVGDGRFATSGWLNDDTVSGATLFGTAQFAPDDTIFRNGFE